MGRSAAPGQCAAPASVRSRTLVALACGISPHPCDRSSFILIITASLPSPVSGMPTLSTKISGRTSMVRPWYSGTRSSSTNRILLVGLPTGSDVSAWVLGNANVAWRNVSWTANPNSPTELWQVNCPLPSKWPATRGLSEPDTTPSWLESDRRRLPLPRLPEYAARRLYDVQLEQDRFTILTSCFINTHWFCRRRRCPPWHRSDHH